MQKLFDLMRKLPPDIDCGVISSSINIKYFTRFSLTDGVLVVTHSDAYLLTDFRYYEMAKSVIKDISVICFKDLNAELANIFEVNGFSSVAIESSYVAVKTLENYKKRFKDITFITNDRFDDIILDLRMVKTDYEIKKIEHAQEVTEAAFNSVLNFISEGKTELDIARNLNTFILNNSEGLSFDTIVVSGSNSSLPHGVPSYKPIQKGDLITMDFGAIVDGYHSDMTRTVCVGELSSEKEEIYNIVLSGQKLALNSVKEGIRCSDVDRLVRDYFKKFGFDSEFGHSLGHGVGLDIHERPFLSSRGNIELKKGMVVTIEPGIYLSGRFGVRIEDMILITENGYKNFTKCSKELICI